MPIMRLIHSPCAVCNRRAAGRSVVGWLTFLPPGETASRWTTSPLPDGLRGSRPRALCDQLRQLGVEFGRLVCQCRPTSPLRRGPLFGDPLRRMPRPSFSAARWSVPRLPHCIEAEADFPRWAGGHRFWTSRQPTSRPSATNEAVHPMRCIHPHLGKIGFAYFSPCECKIVTQSDYRPADAGNALADALQQLQHGGERARPYPLLHLSRSRWRSATARGSAISAIL